MYEVELSDIVFSNLSLVILKETLWLNILCIFLGGEMGSRNKETSKFLW